MNDSKKRKSIGVAAVGSAIAGLVTRIRRRKGGGKPGKHAGSADVRS